MINYLEKTVTIGTRTEPIAAFAVWFRTPSGLFDTFESARDRCAALEQDPANFLAPVVVAVGSGGLYEEVPR